MYSHRLPYVLRIILFMCVVAFALVSIRPGAAIGHGGKKHAEEPFSALQAVQKATALYEETRANDPHAAVKKPSMAMRSSANRGDLFADLTVSEKRDHRSLYQQEQFVWVLKWTHIHLWMGTI